MKPRKEILKLIEDIKKLRVRTALEFSEIDKLATKARAILLGTSPRRVDVAHSSGEYFFYATLSGATRYSRPIRSAMYIADDNELRAAVKSTFSGKWQSANTALLGKVAYTLVQDIASFLDFFSPEAAKKALGTFFEGVVASVINRFTGQVVSSGRIIVPTVNLSVSVDLAIWQGDNVKLFVATKTSTRERLSQPFVQKLIISKTQERPSKSILLVIGDVQRVQGNRIQHTFTAGQFRLYSLFVERMDGVYFLDVPPQAESLVADGLLKPFDQLPGDLPHLLA
jgi:hypothetical protein